MMAGTQSGHIEPVTLPLRSEHRRGLHHEQAQRQDPHGQVALTGSAQIGQQPKRGQHGSLAGPELQRLDWGGRELAQYFQRSAARRGRE